jgi:hypothetical protein
MMGIVSKDNNSMGIAATPSIYNGINMPSTPQQIVVSNDNNSIFNGLNYHQAQNNMQQQLNLYENNNKLNLMVNTNGNCGKKSKKSKKDSSKLLLVFIFF